MAKCEKRKKESDKRTKWPKRWKNFSRKKNFFLLTNSLFLGRRIDSRVNFQFLIIVRRRKKIQTGIAEGEKSPVGLVQKEEKSLRLVRGKRIGKVFCSWGKNDNPPSLRATKVFDKDSSSIFYSRLLKKRIWVKVKSIVVKPVFVPFLNIRRSCFFFLSCLDMSLLAIRPRWG